MMDELQTAASVSPPKGEYIPKSRAMKVLTAPEYRWARLLAVGALAFALRRYVPLRHAGKAAAAVTVLRKFASGRRRAR